MPDWDDNSPELNADLAAALEIARVSANSFQAPPLDMPKDWRARIMQGLTPTGGADESWYGKYRGEGEKSTLAYASVTSPELVRNELNEFIERLQKTRS